MGNIKAGLESCLLLFKALYQLYSSTYIETVCCGTDCRMIAMPIRPPPGSLPEAHRVVCLRCVRAFGRGDSPDYSFPKLSSKKCVYCTRQNEKCNPVSLLVRNLFKLLTF